MYIKDIDCTKETPVVLGSPDTPIYGKGIRIRPGADGRKDSGYFEKIYLPELLPLEEYDLIVVLLSGGKDSVACFYKLLELGVPRGRGWTVLKGAERMHFSNHKMYSFYSD